MLRPEPVHFISYPYEWSFGQLQDAALLTLELQERALGRGLTLRDASAYNVQFEGGRPVFIDTLSFEPRKEGAPWMAYRQFCEHFLVPLALMSRVTSTWARCSAPTSTAFRSSSAAACLGGRSWRSPGLLFHVRLHAMAQRRYRRPARPRAAVERPVTAQTVAAAWSGASGRWSSG